MSVRVGCPYCNHKVTLPAAPAGGRANCDRCGEAFPVTGPVEEVADRPEAPTRPADGRPPFLWLVPLLLLVTGGLIGGGAVVWLLRGANRPAPPAAVAPPPAGPVTWPPSAVPLLAHLPRDVGVAFAIQPGPLLAHAERTGDDPKKLLADLGLPDRAFVVLADAGLPLETIDQLAGGLAFPADSAIPRLVVAVKPKPPATVAGVLDKLKATRAGEGYKTVVGGLPVTLADRGGVMVLATADADLAPPGDRQLPAGLREALGQLSPAAFAWVATGAADWADKPAVKAAALLLNRPELPEKLKPARSAAVGLSLEPGLTAKAAVKAAGDEGPLRDKLAAAVAGRDVLVGGGDGWVTLTAKPGDLPRP